MRVLDLFSGVGCFAIATHLLGMETAAFVEIDPACQRLLAQRFPGVPVHGDITTLDDATLASLGPVDLVCGGPPCQPVSVAGQRRGADDDRWLWPEMLRVVDRVRPRYVVAENPPGIVSMGLATVVAALEGLGYVVRHPEIPAGALDADHIRQRVWVLAVAHADADRGLRDGADGEVRAGWDLALAGGAAGRADAQSGGLRRGSAPRQARQPARDGQGAATGVGPDANRIHGHGTEPVGASGWTEPANSHPGTGADADGQRCPAGGGGGVAVRESLPDCDGAVPIGRPAHGGAVAGVRRVPDGASGGLDGPIEHGPDDLVAHGTWGRRYPADYPVWMIRSQPSGLTQRSAGRSTRLKQLGNAIYWPIAYEVLRPIAIREGLVRE